ncbi:hypothetical protein [uncultured Gammaproteobacteria bacterium]|nr:hypothetical protein [uncultured Gammaproteobacteria bacterium]
MLYYSCFFSFLGIIKYEGLHNLVYRVALEYWYNLKPDLSIKKPDMFRSVVFESRE